jgi:hypothetical protein
MLELQAEATPITGDWHTAKKEIRKLGIRVTTSLKSCVLGCCADSDIKEDEPALWQTAKRWTLHDGGYLNHQNLTAFQGFKVAEILQRNGIKHSWEKEAWALEIEL